MKVISKIKRGSLAGLAVCASLFLGVGGAGAASAREAAAAKKPVIQIYHLEGRRSIRPIWACEELQIECEIIFKSGDFKGSFDLLRKVNPWVPMFPTAVYNDQMFVESGAIVEFIVNKFGKGKLVPPMDSVDYPGHLQWMYFSEGTAMYRLWSTFYASKIANLPIDQLPVGGTVDGKNQGLVGIQAVADYMEFWLSNHPYFGGKEFTAADIMMQFTIPAFKLVGGFDTIKFKHIQEWNARVIARPAYKRALARAVPNGANEYGLPKEMPIPYPIPTREPSSPSTFPPAN